MAETPFGVLVGRLAQAAPRFPAVTCDEVTISRAELEARTNRLARVYRDLGVTAASSGKIRAQVTIGADGMTQPTGWHYHVCEGQFVYMLSGWVDLEFEDGQTLRVQAGESLYIPGGLRHNETAASRDLELLEISVPADMGTVACDPPEGWSPRA